ncbi:LacI family DNA-binding transcriptional regulator [Microbacterium sp. 22242]|uniref:LacI family DNA-binding transcriptional regulator n=1 Tax=Microbacterium sp. 22242 TaxID=3453896 RepID=UPI003F836680
MTTSAAPGPRRLPGMADVARLAGVSAQTVSRTLNGVPSVQPETRAKVLAAVEQLGYRRNNAARALSSGRSRAIGVVTLRTGFYSRTAVTVGIETTASESGYIVNTVTTSSLDAGEIERAMSRLADQGVEGIVLAVPLISTTPAIDDLTRAVPTITIDGSRTSSTQVVAIDQVEVGRLATRHLLELGHETVWHVSGPPQWLDASSRTQGWREVLGEAGREAPPEIVGDWSPASGHRAGQILARIPEVTAVFVASDEMAFGLARAFAALGRAIPGDVSIVGVDDIPLAEFCSPALTTVAQPFGDIGRIAVEHLLQAIAHPEAAPPSIASIEPRLVIRGSTAAPRG